MSKGDHGRREGGRGVVIRGDVSERGGVGDEEAEKVWGGGEGGGEEMKRVAREGNGKVEEKGLERAKEE